MTTKDLFEELYYEGGQSTAIQEKIIASVRKEVAQEQIDRIWNKINEIQGDCRLLTDESSILSSEIHYWEGITLK